MGPNWPPAPAPGFATLLMFDAYTDDDSDAAATTLAFANRVMEKAVQDPGPEYLWRGINCHTMEAEYPFYGGHVLEAMRGWRNAVQGSVRRQAKDGGWGWSPPRGSKKHDRLGARGQQTSGTSGRPAWQILRYTRVTGDTTFLEDGLRGLEALERHRIPRGAQGWECPLHCPDILASAYGVRANVEAYRVTDDERYLDQAKYWAWSGLPFTYVWNPDHLPAMYYATTPIIGTTFFNHSWIGVPVNWCGLVYAYGLQELAPFDPDGPWIDTARGITLSTEWMQYEQDHPSAGCYPDSLNLMLEKRFAADINPENIMVNEYRLRGSGVEIKTLRVGEVTVSSGSHLTPNGEPGAGEIRFGSMFFEGRPAYTLVRPLANPGTVKVDGRIVDRLKNLTSSSEGWRYDADTQSLELKLTYGKKPVTVSIR